MKTGKQFDEHIKRVLEGLESSFDPASWESFERRMEIDAAMEADDLLKARLEAFEAPLIPGAWETFEQRIEAEEAADMIEEEAILDQVAYRKLNDLEVPNNDQHWALMARRLEEEFSLRYKLYRYKVAESVVMALMLLTIIRLIPFAGSFVQDVRSEKETSHEYVLPAPQPQDDTGSVNPWQAQAENKETGQGVWPDGSGNPPPPSTGAMEHSLQPSSGPSQQMLADVSETFEHPDKHTNPPQTLPGFDLHLFPSSETFTRELSERIAANQQKSDPALEMRKDWTGPLTSLDLLTIQPEYNWELPTVTSAKALEPAQLRFSIFATTDLNSVSTPPDQLNIFDTLVQTEPNFTLASGYGGGILVSLKKNRWEFQTGGVYSFKRYIPNTPVFLFETLNYYIKEDFHGIQLDILQVPLNVQYFFKENGNWRMYGTAGASGHFITSSVYEIEYERTPTFSALIPPSSPDDTRSIRQEKEFPSGLLDGGSMQDNFYLSANVGFGVERNLSAKWAFFFQPNYQHYLRAEGIGTNKDKIYTLSFFLGTRFSLK